MLGASSKPPTFALFEKKEQRTPWMAVGLVALVIFINYAIPTFILKSPTHFQAFIHGILIMAIAKKALLLI